MTAPIDFSGLPYETWLEQVFGHPVGPEGEDEWYWSEEWTVSEPVTLLEYFTRLCREFSIATSPYDPPQIDQGIWFLLGACIDLPEILVDPDLPWPPRRACVASMPAVYSSYVATFPPAVPLETCFGMWFDLIGEAVTWMPEGGEKQRVADEVSGPCSRS